MSSSGPRIRPGHASDREAQSFRRRFHTDPRSRPAGSPSRRYRYLAEFLAIVAALAIAAWLALEIFSPWRPLVTVRHLMAAPSCERAQVVGLVPSMQGEPGYWDRHDRDGNGVACESPIYHR